MDIFIAYLLGIWTAISSKKKGRAHDHNPAASSNNCPNSDRSLTVTCVPPTPSEHERAERKKAQRRKTVKFWAQVVTAIATLLYFAVTVGIWRTNEQALREIASHPAVALEGNSFETDPRPTPVLLNGKPSSFTLGVKYSLKNYGKATAHLVQSSVTIIEDSLRSKPLDFEQIFGSVCRAEGPAVFPVEPTAKDWKVQGFLIGGQTILPEMPVPVVPDPVLAYVNFKTKQIAYLDIFVCIQYFDSEGKVAHHTRYWYITKHDFQRPCETPFGNDLPDWRYCPILGLQLLRSEAD